MGGFSDYWANEVLDHLFGKGDYLRPAIYVGLSTTDAGDDGAGLSEPVGGGYARKQTSPADWATATDGALSNAGGILLSQASADWGTVTHFVLFDAPNAGNVLAWGQLDVAQEVSAGDTVEFGIGDLIVSLD